MKSILTNIIALTGLVALAGIGYYLFVIEKNSTVNSTTGEEEIFTDNQVFIKQLSDLQTIQLDTSIFEDVRFQSLKSYQTPLERVPAGREQPFREN